MHFFVSAALLVLFAAFSASAETKTLWQIGKYDQSPREFQAEAADHVLYQTGKDNWAKSWTIHPAAHGEYLGARKTPWGESIRLRSSDVNTPAIDLEIQLFDNEKKIEFSYSVAKDHTTAKEAAYFAFPAAVDDPQFDYATQQGWVNPATDMLKGASLEWFSIQKWMAVSDTRLALGIVPVDASLASFGGHQSRRMARRLSS